MDPRVDLDHVIHPSWHSGRQDAHNGIVASDWLVLRRQVIINKTPTQYPPLQNNLLNIVYCWSEHERDIESIRCPGSLRVNSAHR